jgi:Sulfotransferase family
MSQLLQANAAALEQPQPQAHAGSLTGLLRSWEERARSSWEAAWQKVFIDVGRDFRRTVFLAGDGRSGTTWLSDIINYDRRYRYLFEPFHPSFVPLARGFRFFQYVRPESQDQRFLDPARRVVTGACRDARIDSLNKRRFSTRRLVKDIFANLFLKWLHTRFPGMPIVLVTRHPCAVAASKMNLKDWIWNVNPREFLEQPELMADYFEPFRGLIENTTDEFDNQILHWCLTHYVPFKQFRRGEIHLVTYEHLCERREEEIRRLFAFLDLPYDPRVLEASARPSATTRQNSAVVRRSNLLHSWHEHIDSGKRRRAAEIMRAFNLGLYSDEPLPLVADAEACLLPAAG